MPTDVLMGGSAEEVGVDPTDRAAGSGSVNLSPAFRVVYQTSNYFLPQIRELIDRREVINVRPAYQRRLRWRAKQKSRLIESLILNIPVPPVFLYETELARYEVMDGQQRLSTIQEFIAGEFSLTGMEILDDLNGHRYSDCPPRVKRSLDRATLSAVVLLLESDSGGRLADRRRSRDIRHFVFDRLNTGGTRLNPQEIRNALYQGPFNDLLIAISQLPLFTEVFGIPPHGGGQIDKDYVDPDRQKNTLYASMRDCELVLRYYALRTTDNIKGSMKSMLDRTMENTTLTPRDIDHWKSEYEERLSFLYDLFDRRPFRLLTDEGRQEKISAGIYDASMVAVDSAWEQRSQIKADQTGFQARMKRAIQEEDTRILLTGTKNTAEAIRQRIDLMSRILRPPSE